VTTPFRIDTITIATIGGSVQYSFPSALTVLAGNVGVGKSTLFELIKYGLGGDALLADVVTTSVAGVTIEISIANSRYSLTRSTLSKEGSRVKVLDLNEQTALPDHFVDKQEPSLSSFLLSAMDLPDDMRAAARSSGSTNQGARITFNDIFKYMYVSQGDINEQIAGSGKSCFQPKRKSVFEVLFALTNPEILEAQSKIAKIRGAWDQAQHDYSVVLQFLTDSRTQNRIDTERSQLEASRQQERAERELVGFRESIAPTIDRETQTLRDLLGESERSAAEAQNALVMLAQQKNDFAKERSLVKQDIERIQRMITAGERISEIEFAVCPRCMQGVQKRTVPGSCVSPVPAARPGRGKRSDGSGIDL
jgi:RNA polymerase-binding transcription factor DksA